VNPLTAAIAGIGGVMAGSGGIVGTVAVAASGIHRPRTARALARRSQAADTVAAAITTGEALAYAATDENRPALILGCADVLGQHLRTNPSRHPEISAVMSWYDDGLLRLRTLFGTGARHPGTADPLTVAACLLYAADLHCDTLRGRGEQPHLRRSSDLTVAVAALLFNDNALLILPGGYQLVRHRIIGIRQLDLELQGVRDPQLAETCPFCETDESVYDQTRLGCANCTGVGEYIRTVPAVWTGGAAAPKRQAPHPAWWHRRHTGEHHSIDPATTAGALA
jgi:hypothetical protein